MFAGGRRLALPLGLAGGFLAARTLLAALGVVLGQKAWVVRSEAAMAGLALIGYLALIPDHGAMGAAWASVIAYAGAAMLLILVAVRNWQGATPVQRTALPAVLQADLGTNTAAAADDER